MRIVNIHEAKTHLSRLVAAAARGEAFVIARAGRPLVTVAPLDAREGAGRRIGFLPEARVPDDFDAMGSGEIAAAFGGGGPGAEPGSRPGPASSPAPGSDKAGPDEG